MCMFEDIISFVFIKRAVSSFSSSALNPVTDSHYTASCHGLVGRPRPETVITRLYYQPVACIGAYTLCTCWRSGCLHMCAAATDWSWACCCVVTW